MATPGDALSPADGRMAPLRATAIVGLGSIVTLGLSVLSMKAYALLVGPAGVGLLALMQSLVNLGVIVASAGLATSAIRATASALARGDGRSVRAVERAAIAIGFVGGGLGALLLIALHGPLAEIALGSASRGPDVLILAPALLLGVAAGVQLALLTGQHRIREVVAVNIGTAVAAAGFGVLIVATNGEAGLSSALLVTAAVQLALSWLARRRATRATGDVARDLTPSAVRDILRVGLPVAGSQLASGGAMLIAPLLVLQQLGTVEVGYYRAATAISVGYLTFFLAALTQDYLPRISGASDGADMAALVERRMRLVLGLGMPLILGLLAAGPVLVELLYTGDFAPAFSVLQWQLVGDLLRLPAWVLAFVLVARRSSSAYFGAELISGLTLIGGTLAGLALIGLSGAGVGYAASQGLYYAVVWLMVRGRVPTVPGRLQVLVLVAAAACSIVLVVDLPTFQRSALFGAAAVALAALAWPRIYRLHRTGEL